MPELPEVETVKRGLNKLLVGHKISSYTVLREKSFPNDEVSARRFLVGARVIDVKRRAKVLIIGLSSNYSLVIHLKMTGQLVYQSPANIFGAGHPNDSLMGDLPDRSSRVVLNLDNKAKLFFNDQRVFGWMRLIPSPEVKNIDFMKKLGPEPLEKEFTLALFRKRIARRKKSRIKAVLLDQTVLAGIGNIYADESLWSAMIHPETRIEDISPAKIKKLHSSIIEILTLAINQGGSTDKNYVDAEGKRGSYLKFAKVFRREGQQCERCLAEIIKIRSSGRGTHLCPHCQMTKD